MSELSLKRATVPASRGGSHSDSVGSEFGVLGQSVYAQTLVGNIMEANEPYFPPQLVGGTCPFVEGGGDEIVWHASAEACDAERVHTAWSAFGDKIWYLAARSSEMASNTDTWCPFAALLPGMKDAAPLPVCYVHYGEEAAMMMLQTVDGLQIFRGTALVLKAKLERIARDYVGINIQELHPDFLQKLTPVPWHSVSLFEDRARRILASLSVMGAVALAALSFLVWLVTSFALLTMRGDLSQTLERTHLKTVDFMHAVENLRSSPLRDELATLSELNDSLLTINGLLVVYEIKDGKTRWKAIVPPSVTADRINAMGGKSIEVTNDGVIVGNAAEVAYEAAMEGRKR